MKETKDIQIKCRLTKSEKEKLDAYCAKYGVKISDLLRELLRREIK